ncbi:MAG: papain-like cysteine protease family protein [Erysipelotrichaceae bacterium]|nr:papain-like cysteine protease family protein [Erysipelotrichaceae bacterium]MDD4642173.1 papain-like cysteine protease family protein [Erysipelotrichaceae bacterium]
MKRFFVVLIVAILALTGCSKAVNAPLENTSEKIKNPALTLVDYDEYGGADSYGNTGDHADSIYYVNPDFYNMVSTDTLTIISNFKTAQQTTEWSCGNVATLLVLNHFNVEADEMDIAIAMGASVDDDVEGALPGSANNYHEYGTTVIDITNYFTDNPDFRIVETSYVESYLESDLLSADDGVSSNDQGNLRKTFSAMSLYTSDNDDLSENWISDAKDSYFVKWLTGHLNANRPIMVEWGDWDGHWQVIIGYDSMGTPSLGDDILIFADPYDTSDHWQDGYYYYPLERWFYMWADRNVAPKPYQLQPYIIVEPIVQ